MFNYGDTCKETGFPCLKEVFGEILWEEGFR
jgi:hypothetical protein